jgi:hypothetical protein
VTRESLAAALLFSTLACGGGEPALEVSDPQQLAHVELFGYYGSAASLDETLPYSNMLWGGASTAAAARAAGIRAVVDVHSVFRISVLVRPAPEVIEAEWRALAARLAPDLSAVAALYVSDEPYWYGSRNGLSFDEIRWRLEQAALVIHATPGFEHVPLATIFADPELDWIASGEAANPAGFEWVGFDRYSAPLLVLQGRADLFLSLIRPEQRIIAVPDAMLPMWMTDDIPALDRRVEYWLSWVAANPKVIAIAPFIYSSNRNASLPWIGARDLPSVRERYAQIGKWIVETDAARTREGTAAEQGTSAP